MSALPPGLIRPATAVEAPAVAALAARTFADAFGEENRPEDLRQHLALHCSAEALRRQLEHPAWATFVVDVGDALAGFAQNCDNPPPVELRATRPRMLYRLYVERAWWGTGLGQRLLAVATEEARARMADALWLTTWDRNARGLAFYRKAGFREAGTTTFTVGSDPQRDVVLLLPLP